MFVIYVESVAGHFNKCEQTRKHGRLTLAHAQIRDGSVTSNINIWQSFYHTPIAFASELERNNDFYICIPLPSNWNKFDGNLFSLSDFFFFGGGGGVRGLQTLHFW